MKIITAHKMLNVFFFGIRLRWYLIIKNRSPKAINLDQNAISLF